MKTYFSKFLEESSLLRTYFWRYRRLAISGLAALLVVYLLEIIPPLLLKEAIDVSTHQFSLTSLMKIAGIYLLVGGIQAIGRYCWRMWLIRASMFAGRDLRDLYTHQLFQLSLSFFDRKRIGDLMSHATSDVEAVRMMLGAGLLTLADAIFYLIMVPVAMFSLSPSLALLAFIPLPLVPWVVLKLETKIHDRYEAVQEYFGTLSSFVQESLNGIRVTKAFATEQVQVDRMAEIGKEYSRKNISRAWVQVPFGPILDFVMSLGMVLLLLIGGRILIGNPDGSDWLGITGVSLGTFVAFQRYSQKMVWPMAAFGMAISSYQRALSSSGRLKKILSEKSDVSDVTPTPTSTMSTGSFVMRGKIEFKNLSFSYPAESIELFTKENQKEFVVQDSESETLTPKGVKGKLVLRNLTLLIEPGQRVAFVGMIGAGKSALLSLMTRLYPVERGMIFIDDRDINDWPILELRNQVGYVSQDIFLFSESVSENVAYGHESKSQEMKQEEIKRQVEDATKLSGVHEDLLGLVNSYQTRLGERGVNLSGGQKQRVCIARALIKKPAVLILDDALSSVDVQTEEKILKSLRSRPGRNTEIIAAHRISTVRDADLIVVLDRGMMRQKGTHEQLLQDSRGAYRRYYEQQQLQEDIEAFTDRVHSAPGNGGGSNV